MPIKPGPKEKNTSPGLTYLSLEDEDSVQGHDAAVFDGSSSACMPPGLTLMRKKVGESGSDEHASGSLMKPL